MCFFIYYFLIDKRQYFLIAFFYIFIYVKRILHTFLIIISMSTCP